MKTRHVERCAACYRVIPANTEVVYSRARGIRHLGGCAPISTADLVAGRERYETAKLRLATRKPGTDNPFTKHDAANEAVYAPSLTGREWPEAASAPPSAAAPDAVLRAPSSGPALPATPPDDESLLASSERI